MRVFIAIDIDRTIRAALGDLQQRMLNAVDIKKSDAKWVNPELVHITLKFLGEIRDESVMSVCKVVEKVAAEHQGFDISIESVGSFGGKAARVIWVGAGKGSDQLCRIQKDLDNQLALDGWTPEKREFNAHLTLCRVRNSKAGVKLRKTAEDYKDFKLGVMQADSVSVYQSRLTPAGPVYTVLGNYKLK